MRCEEVDEIQCPCTQPRKKVKPNAFLKPASMFKPPLKGIFSPSLTPLNYEERRAIEAHKLEVERKRSMAIIYSRSITYR